MCFAIVFNRSDGIRHPDSYRDISALSPKAIKRKAVGINLIVMAHFIILFLVFFQFFFSFHIAGSEVSFFPALPVFFQAAVVPKEKGYKQDDKYDV